jgi:DNA-binding transcriptional MocR family regulator
MRHSYLAGDTAVKVAESIEAAVRDGWLNSGDRLPSVRDAAAQLGVNRNTVATAYARLRDVGVLTTGGGRSGMRVAVVDAFEGRSPGLPPGMRDLASGNVDARLLPSLELVLHRIDLTPTGYDAEGDEPALVALARDRLDAEGLDPKHMCFFSGALDAIERGMRAQVRTGSTVLVEDPGFPPLLDLLRSMGFKLRPLPLDDEGPDTKALAEGLRAGASAVVLTPRAQNPFGCDIQAARAQEISALFQAYPDTMLVLDDHWGPLAEGALELRTGGTTRWLFVRSVSKFLGPDYRLAVAIGDPVTIGRIRRQQSLGPRWVSRLLQRFVHALWTSPDTEVLLATARKAYRERRDALRSAMEAEGLAVHGRSGIHLWLPVRREAPTVQAMMARGVALQAGEPFRLSAGPGVRVSIANLKPGEAPFIARLMAQSTSGGDSFFG